MMKSFVGAQKKKDGGKVATPLTMIATKRSMNGTFSSVCVVNRISFFSSKLTEWMLVCSDEDAFAPEIDIGQALCQCGSDAAQEQWFLTRQDAIDCAIAATTVEDDCDQLVQSVVPTLTGDCYASEIALDASDRCGNQAVQKIVPVFIDTENPVVSCSLEGGETDIHVNQTGIGVQYNVGLIYNAEDNCNGDLEVKVDVFANEIEDFQSQKMALLYQDSSTEDQAAGLYVATTSCTTGSNGQCIKDPNQQLRLYTVVVTATDPAGRTSAPAECTVLIVPDDSTLVDFDISKSTQRFHLTSYTSTFSS